MNKFVFVVCGGKEHIEELNFSLKFLRHFSKNEIIVITDKDRNEIEVEHDNIISFKTPIELDNHQASIFLKTSIYKYLPKGNNYCYLDSDVVAINNSVDNVFEQYNPPISFASDHCKIDFFSPHAMNCKCIEKNADEETNFPKKIADLFSRINLNDDKIKLQSRHLRLIFAKFRSQPIKYFFPNLRYFTLRYFLPVRKISMGKYYFNKKERCWYNSENDLILIDFPYYEKKIMGKDGIIISEEGDSWETRKGVKIEFKEPVCNHLTKYLKKKYKVKIPSHWQHWNGGVFLFDEKSEEFLSYWHEKTIKEFSNPYTKTRDQGTLALSVWKFGLENHPRIQKEFNWITEYKKTDIAWDKTKGYTCDGFNSKLKPNMLHIYHEWGTKGWSIWDSVIELGEREKII